MLSFSKSDFTVASDASSLFLFSFVVYLFMNFKRPFPHNRMDVCHSKDISMIIHASFFWLFTFICPIKDALMRTQGHHKTETKDSSIIGSSTRLLIFLKQLRLANWSCTSDLKSCCSDKLW